MEIKERTDKKIDFNQLDSLWKAVGWKLRGKKKWEEVLSKSSFVYSLWDGQRLIGFGRIIEDGIMCMFYDVAVLPEYQDKGFGKKIMEKLIDNAKGKKYASIGLFAWEGNPRNVHFYEKFGFKKVKTGMELEKHMVKE
jgi:ribosomal protein S18 acetylase RimI-like enzyme